MSHSGSRHESQWVQSVGPVGGSPGGSNHKKQVMRSTKSIAIVYFSKIQTVRMAKSSGAQFTMDSLRGAVLRRPSQ
jgi:hypothetical protein